MLARIKLMKIKKIKKAKKQIKRIINYRINNSKNKGISIDSLNQNIKLLSERIKTNENKIKTINSPSFIQKINFNIITDSIKEENQINQIIKKRKQLNEIYNSERRIINHSYIQPSPMRKTESSIRASNQRKLKIFYPNKINITKSFPELNKLINCVSHCNLKNKNKIKNKRKLNLYDKNTKSMKYKHYIDDKVYSDYTNSNNSSLTYYNIFKSKSLFNNSSNYNAENSNLIYKISDKGNYKSLNNLNDLNMIKYFNNFVNEKNKNNNFLYNYNNVENNRDNNLGNKKGDFINYNSNKLQNESIDNTFNEIDNQSLLKYRKENQQKLKELNRNKYIYNKKFLTLNILKKLEESKNYFNINENNIFMQSNNQNIKNILTNEKQKIENNLDYYNKELNFNKKKKDLILSDIYGNNNQNKNYFKIRKNNQIFEDINNNINSGVQYENNIYNSIYSFIKYKTDINKNGDIFDNNNQNDIIGKFNFQRKYNF